MKTYTYKDLITAYKDFLRYKSEPYFANFYIALSKAFGIHLEKDEKDFNRSEFKWLFDKSIKDSMHSISPFSGFMEAPEPVIELYRKYGSRFNDINRELGKVHEIFQHELFELIYGKETGTLTSVDLLAHGFDDSQSPPDMDEF